jgi:hypothetical protein
VEPTLSKPSAQGLACISETRWRLVTGITRPKSLIACTTLGGRVSARERLTADTREVTMPRT